MLWSPSQYKYQFSKYEDFYNENDMVVRLSYLYNRNTHVGKYAIKYIKQLLLILVFGIFTPGWLPFHQENFMKKSILGND